MDDNSSKSQAPAPIQLPAKNQIPTEKPISANKTLMHKNAAPLEINTTQIKILPQIPAKDIERILFYQDSKNSEQALAAFFGSTQSMFERWVQRRKNTNTQRAYRRDVLCFAGFMNIAIEPGVHRDTSQPATLCEASAWQLLMCTVEHVQAWRDYLTEECDRAPKTVLRRVTSLARFYEYVREIAAEGRLQVNLPNPAHKNHIPREEASAVRPTEVLSTSDIRRLKEMAPGETVLAHRDRAAIRFYLYTGARISTGCRIQVEDCYLADPKDSKIMVEEKGRGKSKRALGINIELAESLREYIQIAGLTSGPLFRARASRSSKHLSEHAINKATMYRLLLGYLESLPNATKEITTPKGPRERCIYTPHSLRATTATQADQAEVPIKEIRKLLGHKQTKTTEEYIKTTRSTKESASHKLPF